MKSNLIQTKLLVPPTRPAWVPRPHLIEQLNSGLKHKLILVSAPAGYGKSTLLSEWAHQVSMPAAWLSLESADNTPSRFWTYFISALQTFPGLRDSRIGEGLMGLEGVIPSTSPEEAITGLVDEIARASSPFILILDDLHLIIDSSIHTGLIFLLEHLPDSPDGMHLVVASRKDPPWPLARMRARAQTTELRTRDLRFTSDEATQFLNRTMGLDLSAGNVTQLDQRTEGWVAGLQMAALSMQKQEDNSAFLDRFSGSHRYILDYLIEEVLSQQTPKMTEFLLKISILDKLTAPLCDAVTGEPGSLELLIQLEQSNVFLSSLDDEQRWYRYHHLFSDLLRKQLLTSHGTEVPALHSRASEWYEANGNMREAILHALQADDMRLVARLVSGNILTLAEGEALPELLERFQSTHLEDICSRPWLCISVAWAKAYAGQLDEAEALVNQMEAALAGKVTEDERDHLIGHGMTIRAYVQWLKGRFEKAVDISREALTKIPADDALERANILIILGLATQNTDNFPAAIQAFRDAALFSLRSGNRYLNIYASSCLIYALKGIGQLHEAIDTCREIEKLAGQSGEEYFVLAIGLAAKSEILRLWNDLNGSLKTAQQAVTLAEKWKQADTLHYSLSVLTDTYLALGFFMEAGNIIQRSKWIARNVSDWFMEISEFQEAKLNLEYGNWDLFLQWKQHHCIPGAMRIMYYPLLARYFMIKKDNSEALRVLQEGISRLQEAGYWGRTIELYVMRGVVFSALGKMEKALSSLDIALKMGEPEGYVYLFVTQGKPMEKLLRQAVRKGIHAEYAQRLLDVMTTESSHVNGVDSASRSGKPERGDALPETLSDREMEVLRLLNTQLSVPEIAHELTVAPSTVRTHIRVVYNKLGVHGRFEAIQRAKDLKLF
jgi:LuxR family maltose regulon positive regulatory protein